MRKVVQQQLRKEQTKQMQRMRKEQEASGALPVASADNPLPLAFFADEIPYDMCATSLAACGDIVCLAVWWKVREVCEWVRRRTAATLYTHGASIACLRPCCFWHISFVQVCGMPVSAPLATIC